MNEKLIIESLLKEELVQKALEFIKNDQDNSIQEQIDLTCIESPTGCEDEKAKEVCRKFNELGLENVHMDEIKNAIGMLNGTDADSLILMEGHMDTVFPFGSVKERPVIDENGIIHCPGICDNTRGLEIVLAVVRALKATGIKLKKNVMFAGTAREEGTGSLGGMRHIIKKYPDLTADISIDGGGFTHITFNATGIKTLRYTFHGKAGHSFGAFGKIAQTPHALGRAIAKISDLTVPTEPASCFAVTSVTGGTFEGLHAIPDTCSFIINYRSNDAVVLKQIEDAVENAVKTAVDEENAKWGKEGEITYTSELLCDASAGTQSADTPLVRAFASVITAFGEEPEYGQGGCCNSNIPVGLGIPAVCIGGGKPVDIDCRVHSLEEQYPVKDAYKTVQAALLLLMMAAGSDLNPSIFD